MAIKTLAELSALGTDAYAAYVQRNTEAKAALDGAKAAWDQAVADTEAALVSGDAAAYAAANDAQDYNRAKYNQLFNLPSQPLYTADQYKEYVREIYLAEGTELKPLFEQLKTAVDACIAIIPQINALFKLRNNATNNFSATIPNYAKYNENLWMRSIIPYAVDIYDPIEDVLHDGSRFCKAIDSHIQHCDNLISVNTLPEQE